MANSQVNVRPADRPRRNNRTQRSERIDEPVTDAYPSPSIQATDQVPYRHDLAKSANGRQNGNENDRSPIPAEHATLAALLRQRIVWKLMPGTTVGRALVSATDRLRGAKISTASLDAQVILAAVLGVERSWLFAHHEHVLSEENAARYTAFIVRRSGGEPIAYLIGRKEFYGLELAVDPRVLIPRPETELLVDQVLRFAALYGDRTVRIADVGTGSGAIALAIADNCVNAMVYAVDISQDALALAQRNVDRYDGRQQVRLLHGDLLNPLYEQVDIIVANLPYINHSDYISLDHGVRDFEPQVALEAGDDGLDAIRRLLAEAPRYLRPDGTIFLEIGYDQGQTVLDLVHSLIPQAADVELRQDLAGHDRIVTVIM